MAGARIGGADSAGALRSAAGGCGRPAGGTVSMLHDFQTAEPVGIAIVSVVMRRSLAAAGCRSGSAWEASFTLVLDWAVGEVAAAA